MTQQDETRLGEINALLGRGTDYEGKLCFEGRVRIDGRFRGEIHSDDLLILGDGADVDAILHVGKLIVRGGVLRGKVFAAQLVELHAAAKVHADVETPLFFVDRGARFDGRCTMLGSEKEPIGFDDSPRPGPASALKAAAASVPETEAGAGAGAGADPETGPETETETGPEAGPGPDTESETGPETEADSAPDPLEAAPIEDAPAVAGGSDPKPKRSRGRKSRA